MKVNILEAKNRLSQLIKLAQAGEEVIIANRGEPVARLVPTDASAPAAQEVGNGRAIVAWLKAHPLPDYARRTADEIDADIQAERDAWD
ncbi:MAG TPA: type II toxin-antitoxin system prevent-host-death family antitoxin [Stellaceae bacterium]